MTILEQLKRDEGRRPMPYQDSRGIWTAGYGHNMRAQLQEHQRRVNPVRAR